MVHLKFSIYTQQPLFGGVGGDTLDYIKSTVNYPNYTFQTAKSRLTLLSRSKVIYGGCWEQFLDTLLY